TGSNIRVRDNLFATNGGCPSLVPPNPSDPGTGVVLQVNEYWSYSGSVQVETSTSDSLVVQVSHPTTIPVQASTIQMQGYGSIYTLHANGMLIRWTANQNWQVIDGGVTTISVHGDGSIYTLHANGMLIRWTANQNWQVIDSGVSMISVHGDGSIY